MRHFFWSTVGLAAVLCTAMACTSEPATPPTAVVRQVDHVLVASGEARELFTLLSEGLGFPVAWPMENYGSFSSGGIALGDVNLELLEDAEMRARNEGPRWTGCAFEPVGLSAALAELDARGIRHGEPAPLRSGWFTTLWTTVALPEISSDMSQLFLCEYEKPAATRRAELLRQLDSRDGGPLGLQSVAELVFGARELAVAQNRWRSLLLPLAPDADGRWQLGAGPAIRLVQAEHEGIVALVLRVKSLERARAALAARDLLGASSPTQLTLAGPLRELRVLLIERSP